MKRSHEKEMMDLPGNPRDLLRDDLRNLIRLNRYLGGYRGVKRSFERLVCKKKMTGFSLLDVGTGSGDIPAAIALWARKRGISARIVALEPEAVTAEAAALQTKDFPEIRVIRGDGAALPFNGRSFDFVLCSQVLHHFSEEKIVALLRMWSRSARRAVIVSDLIRHPLACYGVGFLTRLFSRNVMTRTDAPLSVRRAFTLREWKEIFSRADIGGFRIEPVFPFRLMASISLEARS
jgi:SAM-dependent methyltransferase